MLLLTIVTTTLEDLTNISLCLFFREYMNACERKSTIIQVQGRKFYPKSNLRTTSNIWPTRKFYKHTQHVQPTPPMYPRNFTLSPLYICNYILHLRINIFSEITPSIFYPFISRNDKYSFSSFLRCTFLLRHRLLQISLQLLSKFKEIN